MDRPEEIWDQLVASAQSRALTPESAKPSTPILRLSRTPSVRLAPEIRRDLVEVAPQIREAIRAVLSGSTPWPLFLCGREGRGKTCAALVLLDYCTDGGEYLTAAELTQRLADAACGRLEFYHGGHGGKIPPEAVWKSLRLSPLVVLDEIGARERVSDHAYEVLKRLIDLRHGRPLVLCSNLTLDSLAMVYDARVTSRIAAGTVLIITGRDRRLATGRTAIKLADEPPAG